MSLLMERRSPSCCRAVGVKVVVVVARHRVKALRHICPVMATAGIMVGVARGVVGSVMPRGCMDYAATLYTEES